MYIKDLLSNFLYSPLPVPFRLHLKNHDDMVMLTQKLMLERLSQLRERHRALDSTITSMVSTTMCNQLELQRLKREKLALKDEIARIEDELYPDIIA